MQHHALQILSQEEIYRILQDAFTVLKKVGCRIEDAEARNALAAQGCAINAGDNIVQFPEQVLVDALKKVGTHTKECNAAVLMVGGIRPRLLDYARRISREGASEDVKNIIKLFNALPYITVASAGIIPFDVPREAADVINTSLLCKFSRKLFIQDVYSAASGKIIAEMLQVCGSKDEKLAMLWKLEASSPLQYLEKPLAIARIACDAHIPIAIVSSPKLGESAPPEPAEALTLMTAEWLSGLAYLASLSYNGGVILASFPTILYEEHEALVSPDLTRLSMAMQQVGSFLGYPCATGTGYANVSWWDMQTGWEKAVTSALGWASASFTSGYAGLIGTTFSPEQLVLDNYVAMSLCRLSAGIPSAPGLSPEKRQELCRKDAASTWGGGSKDTPVSADYKAAGDNVKAHEFVLQIFATKNPEPQLTKEQIRELDKLVESRLTQLGA